MMRNIDAAIDDENDDDEHDEEHDDEQLCSSSTFQVCR